MTDLDRRPGEPLSGYAQRMLDLMLFAKSRVEFEMGKGIDFDVAMAELQEIIDGDGKALAVCEVRKALDFARPYFPRLEIPAYPSDNDLIEVAMEMVRQHERGGYDVGEAGLAALKGMKGNRKEATFTSIDGQEWTMQRVPGETEAEFEERARLFNDLSRSNSGRVPIAVGDVSDLYAEIAEMMISSASLDEILAAHPGADIDAVMRWHAEMHGDDLSNMHAARQWLRRKRS